MIRTLPRIAIPIAIGLIGLTAGLFALVRVLEHERTDALANLEARDRVVAEVASGQLREALAQRLADAQARIDRALADPLAECSGCFVFESGAQRLPRLAAGREHAAGAPALRDLYRDLRAHQLDGVDWQTREHLYRRCAGGADPAAVQELIDVRARFAAPVQEDLALALAVLADCAPPPHLLRGLLRDGIEVPGVRRLPGIQAQIVDHLARLTPDDAAFAVDRTLALSRDADVSTEAFERRMAEALPSSLDLPSEMAAPLLVPDPVVADSHWCIAPAGAGARGVAVNAAALLRAIADRMTDAGLMASGDRLELSGAGALPIAALAVRAVSPRSQHARAAIQRRHTLKLGLVGLCGAMAAAIAGLGLALQQRRRRILELKSRFVTDVSHELRTPLASMRVLAETLARRTAGSPEARDYPQRLLRDIDGMSLLVENILSFNRLVKGRWVAKREVIRVSELVAGACETASEVTSRELDLDADLGDAVLRADPELLRLLFSNLAVNAVTYNQRDRAEIRVEARPTTGGGLTIEFADNGVGIDAADRARIFDEFYRGRSSSLGRGSGLGLALCRRIMTLHGGSIEIAESGPDGTRFRIQFP